MGKRQRRRERREHVSSLPDGILAKVRAILAKAESTTFQPEADAFMAKAQELMTRYRIDRTMLTDGSGRPSSPGVRERRIPVDDPYAKHKSMLLSAVARANGCETVWCPDDGESAVFGEELDLDGVEELFTSLLVQVAAAMQREGRKVDGFGTSRTRRFRTTFVLSFAIRIGERLKDATASAVAEAEAEYGGSLLPVLAGKDEAAAVAAKKAFPRVKKLRAEPTDNEGWFKGRLCADAADLAVDDALPA